MATYKYYGSKENEEKYRQRQREQAQKLQDKDKRDQSDAFIENTVNRYNQQYYDKQNERAKNQDTYQQILTAVGNRNRKDEQNAYDQAQSRAQSQDAAAQRQALNQHKTAESNRRAKDQDAEAARQSINASTTTGAQNMRNQARQNRTALSNLPKNLDKAGQDLQSKMSNVSSQNPNNLPAAQTKREWKNHKYIAKVTTKSGKIRYIYDHGPSGGTDKTSNQGRKNNAKGNLLATQRQAASRNTGGSNKTHSPVDTAKRAVERTARNAINAGSKAVNSLMDAVGNTPVADLGNAIGDAVSNIKLPTLIKL